MFLDIKNLNLFVSNFSVSKLILLTRANTNKYTHVHTQLGKLLLSWGQIVIFII